MCLYHFRTFNQLFFDYRPEYHDVSLSNRRSMLKMYKFTCECKACINDWPNPPKNKLAHILRNNRLLRFPLKKKSLNHVFESDENIDPSFVKRVYKYMVALEEYAPCMELVILQNFTMTVLYLLGNSEPPENIVFSIEFKMPM